MKNQYKSSIFSIAHTNLLDHPSKNQNRTMRQIVYSNISGNQIQLKLANLFGLDDIKIGQITIAKSDRYGYLIDRENIKTVKYNKKRTFFLKHQSEIFTDLIDLNINVGDYIAISIYYPDNKKVLSGNVISDNVYRSYKGDFTREANLHPVHIWKSLSEQFLPYDPMTVVSSLKEVIVSSSKPSRVVAVFGDSLSQQGTWTIPLSKKLYSYYEGDISLNNFGIGGNRLCHDAPPKTKGFYGVAGVKRFKKDLLNLHGLSHVVLALGINDLGLAGREGTKNSEVLNLDKFISAQKYIVNKLRKLNVKIYIVTMLPRAIYPPFSNERNEVRKEINDWIRSSDLYDGVLDFDSIVRKAFKIKNVRKNWFIIDGLHLTKKAGRILSDNIDIELFK